MKGLAQQRLLEAMTCMMVSDNGLKLISHAVLAWCQDTGVECIISRRTNRSRMALWNRSMVACARGV